MKLSCITATLACALLSPSADALTTRCVATVQELRDALELPFNGDDVEIRIEGGVYSTGGTHFQTSLATDRDLEISGGWTTDCVTQLATPTATVLDGGDTSAVLHLGLFNSSTTPTAYLHDFTLANGFADAGPAAGLWVNLDHGNPEIHLDRLRFVSNRNTGTGGALHIRTLEGGVATLRNSFVTNNEASDGAGVLVTSGHADALTLLVNNTIADNHAVNANLAAGGVSVRFSNPSTGIIELRNNAIAGNTRGAGELADAFAYLGSAGLNGMFNAYSTPPTGQVADMNSLIGDPAFVAPGDHRLAENSPLVDAGDSEAGDEGFDLDFFGNPRVTGAAVDIGAHELRLGIFADGFE